MLDLERWRLVSPLLDRALEMDPDELALWLASLRHDQPELASDLDLVLAKRDAMGREGFLDETDAPPLPDPSPDAVGPYRLIRRIGEGGMGIVYLAEQTGPLRREVALKVIRPGLDSKGVLARFAVERQILANLNHAGISKVYDAGVASDGRPYVAMEYVPGVSLTRFCDEGRLTIPERLALFLQVCAAIQHAHQKGVIHRDIKPSNLLVSVVDGRPLVKVIDFGIAKALQPSRDEALLTQTGATLGTPEYMSPEQASPDAGDVDTRSDVYALGVVLYELLAGGRPFEARDLTHPSPLALLEMVRDKDPPRLTARLLAQGNGAAADIAASRGTDVRRLLRRLGGELEWITTRALEKQPARRYGSAAELGSDVERHLKGDPVLAGPPSTLYRIRKLARRHRAAAIAMTAVAIAVTAGGAVSTLALLRAVRSERLGRGQLRASLLNQAVTLTNSGELDRRSRALEALRKAAAILPGLDARNAALAALTMPGFHVLRRWDPLADGALQAWPDTRLARYARSHRDGTISIHRMDDDAEVDRLPSVPVSGVADTGFFSPDGAWLAVSYHDRSLYVWHLPTRSRRLLLDHAYAFRFTPDSHCLIASSKDRVHVFPLPPGASVHVAGARTVDYVRPAVHPSLPLFLVPSLGAREIEVRRTADGGVARTLRVPPLGMAALWSPDGTSLITAHLDNAIRVWDWPAMGAPRLVLRFHEAEPVHLATDPSGRWLATAGWDNQIGIFDLRDGRLLVGRRGNYVYAATDRPAFLLINGHEWALVGLEPPFALEAILVPEASKGPLDVTWSPDGRWLATAGPGGVRILDRRSGDVRSVLDGESSLRVGFSSDGRELHAVTMTHLHAWTLGSDPSTGALRIERRDLPGDGDRPVVERGSAGISPDGDRWMSRGRDPERGTSVWYQGRFDSSEIQEEAGLGVEDRDAELSNDGRWIAWGNWQGHQAAAKRLGAPGPPATFPAEQTGAVAFTPDDRRLALGTSSDIRFYDVGTWRPAFSIPRSPVSPLTCSFAFTRDSRICAVALPLERILLLDTATGEELGSIPASQHTLARLSFSPDDASLAVASMDHQVLIWDLGALRGSLREIGLDWEPASGHRP